MSYGPKYGSSPSPLAHDGDGQPAWSWDSGLTAGTIAPSPSFALELTTAEGKVARASFPAAVRRVLVSDPGRELVTMHWAPVTLAATLGRRKKIAGVHAFVEQRSDGLVVLELVLSNGQVDPQTRLSHLGAIRHRRIRLVVDPAWGVAGNAELSPDGDWYFPSRAWTSLRVVLWRKSDTAAQSRAWALANHTDIALPASSIASPDLIPYARTNRAPNQPITVNVRQGAFTYDRNDALPGVLPKGAPDAPAGRRVEPVRAWEANESAARQASWDVPKLLAGHPVATFEMASGEPVWPERWPNRGEYHLTGQRIRFDPWVTPSSGTLVTEFGWATNGVPREMNPGPCANRALALNYSSPYDSAHLCRVLYGLYAAWTLTRSWAAWLGLRTIAADVMTSWTLYGRPWDQYWKAFSLEWSLKAARAAPGKGNDGYLREQAWVSGAIACALSVTPDGLERSRYLATREAMLEFFDLICLPSGIARDGHGNSDNNVPWGNYGLSPDYGAAATFQIGLWAAGMHQLLIAGPRTQHSSSIVQRMVQAGRTLYVTGPLDRGSPDYYLATSKRDATGNFVPEHPITHGVGRAHDSVIHGFDTLARLHLLTGDPAWLGTMERLADPPLTGGMTELRARLFASLDCWRVLALKVT